MARARVHGFQGDDPSAADKVLACAKHWVAYGAAEGGRDYDSVDLSEQTLRTIYFPPFRAALEAGAGTVFKPLSEVPLAWQRSSSGPGVDSTNWLGLASFRTQCLT
jgi:beta-glucosidase